jgi:hypothetical protein
MQHHHNRAVKIPLYSLPLHPPNRLSCLWIDYHAAFLQVTLGGPSFS